MADKHEQSRGELSIKVNVDVSEALTGLKAIQREARDAAKALRELEEAQSLPLKSVDGGTSIKSTSVHSITDDIRRSYE